MVELLAVWIVVTGLSFRVFADHWDTTRQERNLILTDYMGSRRLAITLFVCTLRVADLHSGVILHQQVAFVQIALIFTLGRLLFEGVIALGHLNDIPVEAAVERPNLPFRNGIPGASSLLRMLLHGVVGLYARLLSATSIGRPTVSFGRVVLLDLHRGAHGGIRDLRRV